ncbi:ubiquitin-conjugating enzyme E2 C-like isoform X1 [Vombatus ursinus]|uniref:ubiquitin-conjugating enzyme E2 C-like isoform X1 n=1 Tax=Vombatus ursinus TaxID=29139 RepID=UPI000FFD13F1|nr:ubiquitin-conjugating enzyme E2 C-like isoform X1 [Vombatus ursinus]
MALQNRDLATASTTPAACKGAEQSMGKRLQQELMTLMVSGDKGISAFPVSDNLFKWFGTIHGAAGTVCEDLRYKLSLELLSAYPYNAPTDKRSALYDVRTILLSIQSLLGEPNIDSTLNTHAAELWTNSTVFKKYLLETYMKQVTSQEP